MAVSLGTIFILNSIALLIFPPIGNALHLSQSQFGLWAALAIHDTSSVVGAATRYGAQALVIGTTVKLARALWIVPLALATAAIKRSSSQKLPAPGDGSPSIPFPWFIALFILAAVLNTYVRTLGSVLPHLFTAARPGLTARAVLVAHGMSPAPLPEGCLRPPLPLVLLCRRAGRTSSSLLQTSVL